MSDEDRLNLNNIGQDPSICCIKYLKSPKGQGGSDNAVVMIETPLVSGFSDLSDSAVSIQG